MAEPLRIALAPFQREAGEKFSCTAGLEVRNGLLRLEYAVTGPIADIRIPQEAVLPGFTLGLWQHTCCECFLRRECEEGYTEWNFALDCNWWSCAFDGYRAPAKNQRPDARPQDLEIVLRENLLVLTAAVALQDASGLLVGPAVVIEHASGARSHWAATHPADKPDFHRREICLPLT